MEKKIPFFKKIILSIKDLDKYNLLIAEKMRRSIIYLLELMLIFTLVLSLIMTYKTRELINEVCEYANENIPNFTIDENGLVLENSENTVLEINKDLKLKLVLDDDVTNTDNYKEQMEEYDGNFIFALKDKLVMTSNGTTTELSYTDLRNNYEIDKISKENLINIFQDNNLRFSAVIFASIFGATYLIYTVSSLIDALALSLLVIIISKMAKITLKYSQAVTIGISALTLPIIINLIYSCVNILTDFYMPYFQIMYTLISYIYIVAVILIMRSDLIKKKQLIKATIEIKELEKNLENKEKPDEKKKEEPEDKEEKPKDKNLGEVKKRVKGKLKKDKDNPEPQANIEGGEN